MARISLALVALAAATRLLAQQPVPQPGQQAPLIRIQPQTASTPAPAPAGDPVTLQQPSPDTYRLANGILTVTLNGPEAAITSILFKGEDMVSQHGRHDHIYFSLDGPPNYQVPINAACTVNSNTPDMADVGCKHTYTPKDPHAVDIDIHYVLRRNKPGVYVYAILSHPASYPKLEIGEWRMVWPTNTQDGNYLLDKIYVDDKRHWTMPSPADLAQAQTMPIKEVSLFRTGPWAGKMESKYTYSANYEDNGAWGFASDTRQLGAWIVLGNYEYFNDGPHKQDLTALDGTFTLHLNRNHYSGTPMQVPAGQQWSKTFGPYLLFFNSGMPSDALWSDARAQSLVEHNQWPYSWLTGTPEYPNAAQRGAVSGKFLVADSINPRVNGAYASIGLAQPSAGLDYQSESSKYQYWTHARADGSFTVYGVRPGTYTLYAYLDGEVGQYVRENVTVTPQSNNTLGNITWTVPRTGTHFAWEIGFPNRDSTEFRHGVDFFTPYLYKTFARDFPNPLVYNAGRNGEAGKSTPAKDWNYAQSLYIGPDGHPTPWRWTVRFNLASLPTSGEGALVLAIAGANQAHLRISLNGKKLDEFEPKFDGGNGLLRQSSYSKYSNYSIPVPMSKLHTGENTLDFDLTETRGEGSVIFYDYLALEMP